MTEQENYDALRYWELADEIEKIRLAVEKAAMKKWADDIEERILGEACPDIIVKS